MAVSQSHPLPRRFAFSAGRSLMRWATRPPRRSERRPQVDRSAAMLRDHTQRQLDRERENTDRRLALVARQI